MFCFLRVVLGIFWKWVQKQFEPGSFFRISAVTKYNFSGSPEFSVYAWFERCTLTRISALTKVFEILNGFPLCCFIMKNINLRSFPFVCFTQQESWAIENSPVSYEFLHIYIFSTQTSNFVAPVEFFERCTEIFNHSYLLFVSFSEIGCH